MGAKVEHINCKSLKTDKVTEFPTWEKAIGYALSHFTKGQILRVLPT